MIVLVALGRIPGHAACALRQARLANPREPVVLIHDGPARGWRTFAKQWHVRLDRIDRLRRDARMAAFYGRPDPRRAFRRGFWQHASGRLFALRAFMEHERVDQVTHIENDVLLYAPLERLRASTPFTRPVLSSVFESRDRAIPGIVQVGARAALDAFTDFVLAEPAGVVSDDMHRLAAFRTRRPDLVADLPTLPPPAPGDSTESLFDPDAGPVPLPDGRWLFDGARFGQYLGGIDPRNSPAPQARWLGWQRGRLFRPNGFVNESCVDAPSRYRYTIDRSSGLAAPAIVAGGGVFPLATLHVHSKKLRRFTSDALAKVPS